ncbi:MAG: SLC13/DASS family transporter [Maricaulaceae bacterium]|nr:SLC13/DASS family transporter [Maricaulaceae bacterium]
MARKLDHKRIGLLAGLVLAGLIQLIPVPADLSREAWILASLAVLMACWWATEAIPIPATALIPMALFPLFGVAEPARAAAPYASTTVMLLLGGFIVAMAIERWNLHARIALNVVYAFGGKPGMMIAGFMAASALLSMWISNTATTLMMIPIALKVADELRREGAASDAFPVALALGVAYAASIGGLATPVGTPTNLIAIEFLVQQFGLERISFAQWMMFGVPAVLLILPAGWFVLTRWAFDIRPPKGGGGKAHAGRATVLEELRALGPMTAPEVRVALMFALIAGLWMFRPLINNGLDWLGEAFGWGVRIAFDDMQIALFGAFIAFLIPAGGSNGAGRMLMDWESAVKIPWGVLLLFGGGLSLAAAMTATGLAPWLGAQMGFFAVWPEFLIVLAMVLVVLFLTELTSNVATTSAFLPVIGVLAVAAMIPPERLVIPVALAASCAFMLPVATAPNAIVYASGRVTQPQMIKAGFRLNLLAAVLIAGAAAVIAPRLFPG